MKRVISQYLFFIIILLNIFLLTSTENISAKETEPKNVYGKVVYADNGSPVNDGLIKVFQISDVNNRGKILESTIIDPNGEFKLFIPPVQMDGIKIMAYPNDYDNQENPFESKVIDAGKIFANHENEAFITIEVNRVKDNINKSQGSKKLKEESNSILSQNYPNPFNPSTLIRFELQDPSRVTLKVYNMSGEVVATLAENKNLSKGLNEFEFDAASLSSGIYIYSLTAGNYIETKKMMLLK